MGSGALQERISYYHSVEYLQKTFLLLVLLCFLFSGRGYAEEIQDVLVLTEDTQKVSVLPYLSRIKDPRSQFSYRTVLEMYEQGNAERFQPEDKRLTFGLEGIPSWFVLPIRNDSDKEEELIFMLTGGNFQTQGLINKIVVFGTNEDKSFSREVDNTFFKFGIPAKNQSLLLIYIEPSMNWPVTVKPHILSYNAYFAELAVDSRVRIPIIYLLLGIGLTALVILGFQNKNVLFFSAAFIFFAFFIGLARQPYLESFLPSMIYSYLFIGMILATAVGVVLQNGIRLTDKNEMISIGLPVCLTILCSIFAHLVPPGLGLLNTLLITIPPLLLCLSLMIISLVLYQEQRSHAVLWSLAIWFFLVVSLLFFGLNGLDFYIALPFMPIWLPYFCLSLSMICMIIYVFSNEELTFDEFSSSFSQLPTTIKGLKAAEEEGEYDRLMMVVERERKIMAELREIDKKRRKEMQKSKDSADEANRAKSAFLAVISHEIRTPMTGVLGLIRMLLDTPLTAEQQKYSKTILDSGESMIALLNDILDFEKIESGNMLLEETEFEIDQVTHSAATLMAGHAQNKNIDLRVSIHENIPLNLIGDPSRLRQVLLNLIGNAIKFTDTGGVYIDVRHEQELSVPQEDSNDLVSMSITVRDTGIGIPSEALKGLFDPFAQADTTISRKYGGSGLGLAICKRLIEAMGGMIRVESKEGEGSTFKIYLNLKKGESVQSARKASKNTVDYATSGASNDQKETESSSSLDTNTQSSGQGDLSILIVEDNEVNQQVIVNFLTEYAADIISCASAEEALEHCSNMRFDLIFMDWELPGMNGPDAIKVLRSESDKYISFTSPVVLLTGHRVSIEEAGLEKDQVSGILNKPVSPEQIQQTIHEIYPPINQDNKDLPSFVREENVIESLPDETTHKDMTWPEDIFDQRIMRSLIDTLGEEKILELLDNVIEKTAEIIESLEKAVSKSDIEEISARSHELKGMAGNFALHEIHDYAAELEKDAKESNGDASQSFAKIKESYNKVETFVSTLKEN